MNTLKTLAAATLSAAVLASPLALDTADAANRRSAGPSVEYSINCAKRTVSATFRNIPGGSRTYLWADRNYRTEVSFKGGGNFTLSLSMPANFNAVGSASSRSLPPKFRAASCG